MALGARHVDVLRIVFKYAGILLAMGLAIGIPGAVGAGALLASQLFSVPATAPSTYIVTTLLLLGTGLGATAFPAARAIRLDPIAALRNE